VDATPARFAADIEAAVYFCCLEAMQNAGKYAGDGAHITVTVTTNDERLVFEVVDDGVGFDSGSVAESHGFVNMRDRVGAHGGDLTVESSVGHGTRIVGELPLPPAVG
jgi:signal transduction histidine kinase